ncbi:hypothetical protein ABPG77_010428 [Micractinium sp. CCAP 211/92]
MIVYRKAFLGLHLLFRFYGSAIVRTALWGALAATQTTLLYVLVPDYVSQFFTGVYGRVMAYTVFTALLSLLVVFRQNAGYGRFHEGRVRLQAMTSAWTDACIKALSFDGGCRSLSPPDEASRRFCSDCVHLFSLLHAVALQFLRSDWLLENLSEHDQAKLPPWDSGNSPNYKPSLLDYLVLRSVSTRRLPYNAAHPIPVIGRLSAAEEEQLKGERTRTLDNTGWGLARKSSGPLRTFLRYSFGPSQGKYVRGAAERTYQVFSWVHERCRHRMVEDGLDMPAPILATMYSSLQKGLEAFEQCRYLCDTPFPFSWSQLLMAMLLANQFMLPFVIVSSVRDWALGIVFATVATQAYWALNEVAREMEDPYCFEPNDIPLPRLQYQFNERLLAAANSQFPGNSASMDPAFQHKVWRAIQRAASGSVGAPDAEMSLDAEVEVVVAKG